MSNLSHAFDRFRRVFPDARSRGEIRDAVGVYALDVLIDGRPMVFCCKRSIGAGEIVSVHADLAGRRVPILLSLGNIVYELDPFRITSRYSFVNNRNGATMLNFTLEEVEAREYVPDVKKRMISREQLDLLDGAQVSVQTLAVPVVGTTGPKVRDFRSWIDRSYPDFFVDNRGILRSSNTGRPVQKKRREELEREYNRRKRQETSLYLEGGTYAQSS